MAHTKEYTEERAAAGQTTRARTDADRDLLWVLRKAMTSVQAGIKQHRAAAQEADEATRRISVQVEFEEVSACSPPTPRLALSRCTGAHPGCDRF